MTQQKKYHQNRKEREATEDVSAESSKNDLGMSGENALSNEETEFVGKKMKMILWPSSISLNR